MADSIEAIQKAKKTYLLVFGALLVGTVLTVLVATVPALDIGGHGFDMWDAVLGLCIATTKASLVAAIFMHLNHEKKLIYWVFFGAIFFFGCMGALFALAETSPIYDTFFYKYK
jgi:caa(3)-type oxidase subunit IV